MIILITTFSLSLLTFLSGLIFVFKVKPSKRVLLSIVSFAAGTMFGGAFLHLLPEAYASISPQKIYFLIIISFVFFFIMEKVLHWHHCHDRDCKDHQIGYLNLVGDALHNFLDGLIIASSFSVSTILGIATAISIAAHELPQEVGDLGILLYAGIAKKRAMILNLLVSATTFLGGVFGLLILDRFNDLQVNLLPIAAGGFIYISVSDLIPEFKKAKKLSLSMLYLMYFISGNVLMFILQLI